MQKKKVNVKEWLIENGIIEESATSRDVSNGIRWFKRNIVVESLICLKRGVYQCDADDLESALIAFEAKKRKTLKKKRTVMMDVNRQMTQKRRATQILDASLPP